MKAPHPEDMFDRLLRILKLERSVFVPAAASKMSPPAGYVRGDTARMTRGLSLESNSPGDGVTRWSVATHSGEGTGEGQILFSLGAREFAEKVWAIEAGIECARRLGVNVGDL